MESKAQTAVTISIILLNLSKDILVLSHMINVKTRMESKKGNIKVNFIIADFLI